MPYGQNDLSDSDDELLSGIETSVLLGVPDGELELDTDATDAAVSRIGGRAAFLPSREPPLSTSQCKICSNPSELLVQLWCPFEDSPMDRALYIWGCSRATCQGKQGSIRAWRGLRRNEAYAAKLKKRQAKKRSAEGAKTRAITPDTERGNGPIANPFSVTTISSPGASGVLGIGMHVFGETDAQHSPVPTDNSSDRDRGNDVVEDGDAGSESSTSEEDLVTAVASATLAESPWTSAPSYTPVYLSTTSEYLPPPQKTRLPPEARITDVFAEDQRGKDVSWAMEAYENSLDVDQVFERFMKRVGHEGKQCIRYELNGAPLPYSSDKIFESLFPSPPAPALPITKAGFTVVSRPKREYFPSSLPSCPSCRAKRVFECQLMPNLINVLRQQGDHKFFSEKERRKVLERALGRDPPVSGDPSLEWCMEWGTCMVFSCEKDCCVDEHGSEAIECWREEVVLIQVAI